ncbi:fasciclin domain-containing protein [Nocardioides fonticola]|uniref:Fasciclin domain-containing protein n=1 Tax=Nocardioides fonticola TaxID=450363 RepID=A0ABP7XPW0_9ACTN
MKRTTLRRTGALAAATAVLSMGLAACGSDDESDSTAGDSTPTAAESTDSGSSTSDAAAQVFGPGCAKVPTDPTDPGSFDGMVQDPVATAASNNPLLTTLVAAVKAAGLVDTLNNAEALTVFAPTDDAFKAIDPDTLNAVLKDKKTLTAILTHHVIGEQLDPTAVVGEQTTLNGDTVTVAGDTDGMTVKDSKVTANVLCGNIPTANATVYVIDSVLMP